MLATIPLLGKPSDLALLEIIGYHNNWIIPRNKVDLGKPVATVGRRTRILMSAKPSTPYRENNYIESMYFTYNRLNLTEVFFRHIFTGIELQPPVTTKIIVDLLKTFIPFISEDWEFLPNTVFTTNGTFLLTAHPDSLRWQGSIAIPLSVVNDNSELLPVDLLKGLEDRNFLSAIEPFIYRIYLDGLDYAELLPSLISAISKTYLKGLENKDFENYLSYIIPNKFMAGHWILNSLNGVEITSDISKPGLEALGDLIDNAIVVDDVDYTINNLSAIAPGWASKGRVDISSADSRFLGGDTLYFEKIDIADIAPGGTVVIDGIETFELALIEINDQLGTNINPEQVLFTQSESGPLTWILSFLDDDPMFYGDLIVNDDSITLGLFISGLKQISDTEYYKFKETVSYSEGPDIYNTPPLIDSLRIYRAFWTPINGATPAEITIERRNDLGNYIRVAGIPLVLEPNHVSLSFDQNGSPTIGYSIDNALYLYFYDLAISGFATAALGSGRAPFSAMSSFNEFISTTRQGFFVYVRSDNTLCYRAQNDRYTIEYVIESDVIDIMTTGRTVFNSFKVEYLKSTGVGSYQFKNIATPRDGLWNREVLNNTLSLEITNSEIKNVVVNPGAIIEKPIGLVSRGISDVSVSTFTYTETVIPAIIEKPIGLVSRGISDVVLNIRPQSFTFIQGEPEPESSSTGFFENETTFTSFSMSEVRVDLYGQGDEEPGPSSTGFFTNTTTFASYSVTQSKASLQLLYDEMTAFKNTAPNTVYGGTLWVDFLTAYNSAGTLLTGSPTLAQSTAEYYNLTVRHRNLGGMYPVWSAHNPNSLDATSITVPLPNAVIGELLIATIAHRDTINVPGWTHVYTSVVTDVSNGKTSIYTKLYDSGTITDIVINNDTLTNRLDAVIYGIRYYGTVTPVVDVVVENLFSGTIPTMTLGTVDTISLAFFVGSFTSRDVTGETSSNVSLSHNGVSKAWPTGFLGASLNNAYSIPDANGRLLHSCVYRTNVGPTNTISGVNFATSTSAASSASGISTIFTLTAYPIP